MRIINRKNHIATNQKKRDEFHLVTQSKELSVLTLWLLLTVIFSVIIGTLVLIYFL